MSKHETLSWNHFSTARFSRGDTSLRAMLQFSASLTLSPSLSTSSNKEFNPRPRKHRKAHNMQPAIRWDYGAGGRRSSRSRFQMCFAICCGEVGGWSRLLALEA
ncbi:hypothetical protein R3P38DRAFT_2878125 [Favolaschia claudopus]|uniref:Uncharacterized protein n=1 Tax=Favolaschia claudopus TaxID=2862362 RepID=A0AAW0CVK5_9AGAR